MSRSLIILDLWKLILFRCPRRRTQSAPQSHVQGCTHTNPSMSTVVRTLCRRQMLFRPFQPQIRWSCCSFFRIGAFVFFFPPVCPFYATVVSGFPLPLALIMNPISGSPVVEFGIKRRPPKIAGFFFSVRGRILPGRCPQILSGDLDSLDLNYFFGEFRK